MKSPRRPCASCPWRRDADAGDIPNFDLGLAEKLADTCPDDRGVGPHLDAKMFACHESRPGRDFTCAGWLAKVGHRHPTVRKKTFRGELDPVALRPGTDWPALHDDYQEVLEKLRSTI
ncbi:DUF6283 family protein [Burkholderia multivorans]